MTMSTTKSLLVELFVEELPPKALKKLGESFAGSLAASLRAQGLAGDHAAVTPYATPRRLAAHISAVQAQAADRTVTHKLMPVGVALDAQGQPTPALLKKLAAVGADASVVPHLERKPDGKAESLFWTTSLRGATLAAGLQVALDAALAALPIPKLMSYQLEDGWTSVNFVRPAHGLVALHGADTEGTPILLGFAGAGEAIIPGDEVADTIAYVAHTTVVALSMHWDQAIHDTQFHDAQSARIASMEAWARAQADPYLEGRILHTLRVLARLVGKPHARGTFIAARITHAQLAAAVCATRSTVTRLVGTMRQNETLLWVRDNDNEVGYCLPHTFMASQDRRA